MFNLKNIFLKKALVLMYHRIATANIDPWELAVSAENFEQHLRILKKLNNVLPLPELVHQLQNKKLKKRYVAITFDDGYIDNYQTAKPLLEKSDIPATFFITTNNLGQQKEFWWDELAYILLKTPNLPKQLSLEINNEPFSFNLDTESKLTKELNIKHKSFIAWEPTTLRSQLYYSLWEKLSPLQSEAQENIMAFLRSWAGTSKAERPEYLCMSVEQMQHLSSSDLFTIGGHTCSHPALAYHSEAVQQKEIIENKKTLENLTGKEVNLFAYPSGNYNDISIKALKQSRFSAGFTTNPKPVQKGADLFQLNRFQVNNWTGDKFEQMLSKWFRQ
jgi:peptidoglycan/xylan/chitin deacetylase (PgdA/CDA1 family)